MLLVLMSLQFNFGVERFKAHVTRVGESCWKVTTLNVVSNIASLRMEEQVTHGTEEFSIVFLSSNKLIQVIRVCDACKGFIQSFISHLLSLL